MILKQLLAMDTMVTMEGMDMIMDMEVMAMDIMDMDIVDIAITMDMGMDMGMVDTGMVDMDMVMDIKISIEQYVLVKYSSWNVFLYKFMVL